MADALEKGFDETEFAARTAKAQALMGAQSLAGLRLTTVAEIRYFTGFHTLFWQSPTRPWFKAVSRPFPAIKPWRGICCDWRR